MARTEAIILSMTPKERENPGILGNSRKKRIAAGSGTTVVDVNRLLKQYDMMLQLVKQMSGNSRKMKKFAKMGGMPGMGSFPRFLGLYPPEGGSTYDSDYNGGEIHGQDPDFAGWARRRPPTTASWSRIRAARATAASSRR